MHNKLPSEAVAVLGVIDPDAYAASTVTTDWIDVSAWYALMAIVMAGDLGASATIDAKLEQATSSGGAGAKDVVGKIITQLTKAGTDDNKQVVINLRSRELDLNNGYRFVRLSLTIGTAASDSGAIVLGMGGEWEPASDYDAATVDEIVK